MIIVDTSVLIGFLKGETSPAIEILEQLELENAPFALPGVCYQEILQGARDEKEWKLLDNYLAGQELLFASDPASTYRAAARIYFDCRRKGLTVRSTIDCYIAQLVLEQDGILLQNDGDFKSIQKVRPLKILP